MPDFGVIKAITIGIISPEHYHVRFNGLDEFNILPGIKFLKGLL